MAYQLGYTGSEINERLGAVPNKADKVVPTAVGNLPTLGTTGNLVDSGISSVQLLRAALPHAVASGFPAIATQAARFPVRTMRIPGLCAQVGTPSPTSFAPLHTIEGDVKLAACRNNLLQITGVYSVGGGLTATAYSGGSIVVKGTLTADVNLRFSVGFMPPARTPLTISCRIDNRLEGGSLPANVGLKLGGTGEHGLTASKTLGYVSTATFEPGHWQVENDRGAPLIGVFHLMSGGTEYDYALYTTITFGDTALAWEPFEGGVYPIVTLGTNFMASLPDGTADELTVDDWGNVTLIKRVGRITLNGSEPYGTMTTDTEGKLRYYVYVSDCKPLQSATAGNNLYCDRLASISRDAVYFRNSGIAIRGVSVQGFLMYDASFDSDVTAFKAWLAEQPMTVYYPLVAEKTVSFGRIYMPPMLRGSTKLFLVSENGLSSSITIEYAKDATLVYEALSKG